MKIIKQKAEILDLGANNGIDILKKLELAGRTCYKSEDRITDDSCVKFVRKLIELGHESVIEHHSITVRFICSRATTHQMVRTRLASYSMESQRFVNYGKTDDISFVLPIDLYDVKNNVDNRYITWYHSLHEAERAYNQMIKVGAKPELAREVLPNSTKTEIVVTMNLRMWRHFLKQRLSPKAQAPIRDLCNQLKDELKTKIPVIFEDINYGDN
jgi:thymidylate synthase (FAD)